jgi:ADP-heptose:LPS heptosyltransferase
MNWEMLTAIGQLAAVIVGIPSLIYLALQIRAQTKERHQSVVNALTVQWGDLTRSFHDNAEFCAIYLRGVQSFSDLDAVSKLRFSSFLNRFFKNFQAMFFSHRDGVLSASLWGEVERTMSDVIAYPGVQQWWQTRRHWHTEEFARVIDALIARGDKPTAYSTYKLSEPGPSKVV